MIEAVPAYVGVGSNLGDPKQQMTRALQALQHLPDSRLLACSSLYRSAPMGPADQPDYLNAVAMIQTALAPLALLDALQAIEQRQGRVRERRWGPRTIDLDLLLYGDRQIDLPRLQVPHPGIGQRAFVLAPLLEVAGDICIPGQGSARELFAACNDSSLRRLEPSTQS
ncbi:MAG: 2-amino-4-hydroxy-6-hydroxymethyldihydropteridine diphosphokinase [Gammaproteobacteria bacterium]|nr:MAG: 2-amino-4-hydroxy-6-hydroxymethyldihydropteridine diphosphokinase [Gammaproteobacteria bacterium]